MGWEVEKGAGRPQRQQLLKSATSTAKQTY